MSELRESVSRAIHGSVCLHPTEEHYVYFRESYLEHADAVMAVVAPLLAARDAADEDLRAWQKNAKDQAEKRNRAENRAERAEDLVAEFRKREETQDKIRTRLEADLAAARQQLDKVRAFADLLSKTSQQRAEVIAVDVAWKLRQILGGGQTL